MTRHIAIELSETRTSVRKFEAGYRQLESELRNLSMPVYGKGDNERLLRSRNKREGWYFSKHKGEHVRFHVRDIALRYRKQTGALIYYPKAR